MTNVIMEPIEIESKKISTSIILKLVSLIQKVVTVLPIVPSFVEILAVSGDISSFQAQHAIVELIPLEPDVPELPLVPEEPLVPLLPLEPDVPEEPL